MKVSDRGLGLVFTGTGEVSEREYLDFFRQLLSPDNVKLFGHRYCLADWSGVESPEISSDAIAQVAELSRGAVQAHPSHITAVVAAEDFTFGLSRMWELQSSDLDSTIRVFRTRPEAVTWIRRTVEEEHGIDDLTFD